MEKRTSIFTNGIIWFGVAISVSEIECGIEIGAANTPDGLWLPLVLGHVLGGIMLYFVGLIGARIRLNAMETTASTFGKYGSRFFASLNLLQLIGWIAVLNAQGALALAGLNLPISYPVTCIILAALIAGWVALGLRKTAKVTTVVMSLLAILLVVLTAKFFGLGDSISSGAAGLAGAVTAVASGEASQAAASNIPTFSFWTVFEISIAMPLSWLPVISDYTKDAERPAAATAVSAASYTVASFWMYFIGLQIAGLGVGTNIAQAILLAGIGIPGILIVALSTVTTNFLAANSAGESAKAIVGKLNPKVTGVVVCVLSTVLAIWGIVDHYIHFLYMIASVFAPMAAVLLVSFFLVKEHLEQKGFWIWNLFAWLAGFVVYQVAVATGFETVGPTLLAVLISAALTFAAKIKK